MKWHYGTVVAFLSTAILVNGISIRTTHCTVKSQRKAWHTLTREEKLSYLRAEQCLMKLPAKLGLPGTRTRFDELQACHAMQAEVTHGVGAFLPYHRLLMHAHEYLLQTECGYNGTQPYWDEPRDAGKFSKSEVLDPEVGFGGDGVPPSNCIKDGPFVNYTNGIGPGHLISDHCIDRQVNDFTSQFANQTFVDQCYQLQNYSTAWPCIEASPHIGGHGGIGAEMLNPISSPGDPIFYLHHTYLDKVWWGWQSLNLPIRLSEITGNNVQDLCAVIPGVPTGPNSTSPIPFQPNGTFPFPNGTIPDCVNKTTPAISQRIDGDPGNVTTLSHVLNMFGIISNATIGDVMDIGNRFLCYEYV
ncbi:hypothetical protein BGZ60DRAFT_493790 [Tricladium varicosporioides]|nr:hypothetical protein BGZ60DRAFT_493790 [Hymenoscyphus varicosporioides]